MMKEEHAILITAYKEYNILENLVKSLYGNFNIYLHIDRKSKITKEQIELLKDKYKIYVIKKYKINWRWI